MFTGIIESLAQVVQIDKEQGNIHFDLEASLAPELKIDQSIAHNGACLTVVAQEGHRYRVTAIEETLKRTNLGAWEVGTAVNIERCMSLNSRLDGHMVQGHVDTTGKCESREETDGSWLFGISHPAGANYTTVAKGSITINGVSLTVVESRPDFFSVAIIPYTYEHTNFKYLQAGDVVNLEFDIIGKYVARLLQNAERI